MGIKEEIIADLTKLGFAIIDFTFYSEESFSIVSYSYPCDDTLEVCGKLYSVSSLDVTSDDEAEEGLSYSKYSFKKYEAL